MPPPTTRSVSESFDDLGLVALDKRDDLHLAVTLGTDQRVDLIHLLDLYLPGDLDHSRMLPVLGVSGAMGRLCRAIRPGSRADHRGVWSGLHGGVHAKGGDDVCDGR